MKKYKLSDDDLHHIFATRVRQVTDGFRWLYLPNSDFPAGISPREATDIKSLPIELFEESFKKSFGDVSPKLLDCRLSSAKKEAILNLYPDAQIVSFKEMYGHSPTWFTFQGYKQIFCEPSVTFFGDNVIRPRWLSALSDILFIFTLGILKPRRRPGEKCLGDVDLRNRIIKRRQ